jgi:hypothetical protein
MEKYIQKYKPVYVTQKVQSIHAHDGKQNTLRPSNLSNQCVTMFHAIPSTQVS